MKSFDQTAGNPQPRHERFLVRRQKKQAVPLEPKNLLLVRRFVRDGVFQNLIVSVERMQFMLHAFLENQIIKQNFFSRRRCRFDIAKRNAVRGETGEKSFEIFPLLIVERLAVDVLNRKVAHVQ